MPALPGVDRAVIDLAKLAGYALDLRHPRGRDKARVFLAALGIVAQDAAWLRSVILALPPAAEAVPERVDDHGARYRVDHSVERNGRRATVRTVWLVAAHGASPRLVTCYVA